MGILTRLFGKSEVSTEVLCPHCEEAMGPYHDVDRCARKGMSRRFFLGGLGGLAVIAAAPVPTLAEWMARPVVEVAAPVIATRGNQYLTLDMITHDMLAILHNNLSRTQSINAQFQRSFGRTRKIGDTITIRKPARFTA